MTLKYALNSPTTYIVLGRYEIQIWPDLTLSKIYKNTVYDGFLLYDEFTILKITRSKLPICTTRSQVEAILLKKLKSCFYDYI